MKETEGFLSCTSRFLWGTFKTEVLVECAKTWQESSSMHLMILTLKLILASELIVENNVIKCDGDAVDVCDED